MFKGSFRSNRRRNLRAAAAGPDRQRDSLIEQLEPRTLLANGVIPTATLSASNVSIWGPTYTFTVSYLSNKRIRSYQVDNNDITITGPGGYARKAKLIGVVDNVKQIIARYKASPPNSVWNAADNGTYTVSMNAKQVSDGGNVYVPGGTLGSFAGSLPAYPGDIGQRPTGDLGGVNVAVWGAIPNDGLDDTIEIQRAINSLPRGNGVADGSIPVGGTVWLPAGTYNVNGPLSISTGVVLRGQGAGVTTISNSSTDGASAAIKLVSYFGHGFVMQAGVVDMTINTLSSKGIAATSTPGDVIGLRLAGLTISSGGAAIDLRLSDVYQTVIENVSVINPGSTALWMTVPRGNSALNKVENLVVSGHARSGFQAERAMVVLEGTTLIDGLAIGDLGTSVTPLALIGGGTTASRLAVLSTASTLPNGVLVAIEDSTVQFDTLINLDSSRRVSFVNSNAQFGTVSVANGQNLAQALSIDSKSHVSVGVLRADGGVGWLTSTAATVRQSLPFVQLVNPSIVVANSRSGPTSKIIADVTSFGAVPNDPGDDTIAIQKAIDSLPRGNGLPTSGKPVGGLVVLPAGTYITSGELRLPSGVWLQGQGCGTLISSSVPNGAAAVELVSGAMPGYNVGAGIADLAIYTTSSGAAAIHADPSLTSGLFDLRLSDVEINAGGVGVDLHEARTYHARLADLIIKNCGSAAVWMGDDAGYSADNHIDGMQVTGAHRSNYIPLRAQMILSGQNTIENVWLQPAGSHNLPVVVSGAATIRNLWLEYDAVSLDEHVLISFENCYRIDIDRFILVGDQQKVRFRNSTGVNVGIFDTSSTTMEPLSSTLDMDLLSQVNIDVVKSFYDSGMLDDTRVTIGGNYNINAASYLNSNLVYNAPSGNIAEGFGGWNIQWGDGLGAISGQAFYAGDGSSITIQISSNPNRRFVNMFIDLNVPQQLVGRRAIAYMRADGPAAPTMFTDGWGKQIPTRAVNSLTAALIPKTLQQGDRIIVQLPPVASGTFQFTLLGVTPID